jgi:hypothetical protein
MDLDSVSNSDESYVYFPRLGPLTGKLYDEEENEAGRREQGISNGRWECKAARHDPGDIEFMSRLSPYDKMVIMTPSNLGVIPVVGFDFFPPKDIPADDEYRTLVKEIAARTQAKIHHTIYSLDTMFTEHHECLLDDSTAVIMVVDEHLVSRKSPLQRQRITRPGDTVDESVMSQIHVAWSLWEVLFDDDDEQPFPDPKPCLFLIQFGDTTQDDWPETVRYLNIVNCSSYDTSKASIIANELLSPVGHSPT